MKSRLVTSAGPPLVVSSPRGGIFSIPHPDVYGTCNNFYAGHFMEGSLTECAQKVSLESQCESTLNPLEWSTMLEVYSGTGSNSDKIPVTVNAHYTFDAATGQYAEGTGSVGASTLTAATDCSCAGAVKEVGYTVMVVKKDAD